MAIFNSYVKLPEGIMGKMIVASGYRTVCELENHQIRTSSNQMADFPYVNSQEGIWGVTPEISLSLGVAYPNTQEFSNQKKGTYSDSWRCQLGSSQVQEAINPSI